MAEIPEPPNPTKLTVNTTFAPSHSRNYSKSRSPSRSPVRRAQFAARELDPLLRHIDPDSTIRALQQTQTIGATPAEQSALAQSIADASEDERRLGIRAAVAAKNIKEWLQEITAWEWPTREDRAWGAGFLPPTDREGDSNFLGYLTKTTVEHHQDRIDEIYDAMDTLGLDEIKEYVFNSHVSPSQSPVVGTPASVVRSGPTSYGRMRDFTALITATIFQALPDQHNLQLLLNTWQIRLDTLRNVPELLRKTAQVQTGLKAVTDIVHDAEKSRFINAKELEQGKTLFGNQVSSLGQLVDRMLDTLEGQQDRLPQTWLDAIEDIERKYAAWVADAERVIIRNSTTSSPQRAPITPSPRKPNELAMPTIVEPVKRKPLVETISQDHKGHNRGVSEVSAADSTWSIENAQIQQASAALFVPGSRVSMINPLMSSTANGSVAEPNPSMAAEPQPAPPAVPLRSSKRKSITALNQAPAAQTLDDKIRGILSTLPTEAKFSDTPESSNSSRNSSRNSTDRTSPVPGIKLSPVKNSKNASRADTSAGIHVYNITQPGLTRNTPPKQIYVRAVGEHGERVMVRVGGGWADLAEYLREYSLHHGGRAIAEQDIVTIPSKQSKGHTLEAPSSTVASHISPAKDAPFDFGLNRTGSRKARFSDEETPVRPGPVPHQPELSQPHATSSDDAIVLPAQTRGRDQAGPAVQTSSSITPHQKQTGYVALGAAGPIPRSHYPTYETHVQNGRIVTVNRGPTFSTTMTVTSTSRARPARRSSPGNETNRALNPITNQPLTASPAISRTISSTSPPPVNGVLDPVALSPGIGRSEEAVPEAGRRGSLREGVRRVFLRSGSGRKFY